MEVASPELGVQWENDDSTSYASALSSPSRISFSSPQSFYSTPSSPTRGLTTFQELEMARRTKITHYTIDFEFDTSRTFDPPSDLRQQKVEDSLTMAYADELFKNGKVLPSTPPATPPPRIQTPSNRKLSHSSPRRSSFAQRGDCSELGFKHQDADRFVVGGRRSQSQATDGTCFLYEETCWGMHHPNKHQKHMHSPPSTTSPVSSAAAPPHVVPMRDEVVLESMVERNRSSLTAVKGWGSIQENPKGGKIKNFLFRSASSGRQQPKENLRKHTATIWKTADAASSVIQPSSNSKEKMKKKENKEKTKGKEMKLAKKTAMQSKPSLLLCIGYSPKAMRLIN